MRRASLLLPVLSFVCALLAPTVTAQQSTVIQRIIVKVNGEPFTQKELEDRQISMLQSTNRATLQGAELEKVLAETLPDMLVRAVDDLMLLQRGRELNFHMTNEQFDEMVASIREQNQMTEAQFAEALKQEGLTLDVLRRRIEPEHIINQVQRQEVLGAMRLTEQELRQYYDTHPEEFLKPPTVTLREILVAVAAPPPPGRGGQLSFAQPQMTEAAAAAKAEAIRQRAIAGEDFEKLVTETSDSPSKAAGGLVGPIDVPELSDTIRAEVEKLQPGQVTPAIRTPRGFQLLKLESRTEAASQPFDQVRDQLEQKIGESRLEAETVKYLAKIRGQAILDWKRDDLRLMYEKRLAERAAALPASDPATPPAPVTNQ